MMPESLEVFTLEEVASYLRLTPAIVREKAMHGMIPGQAIDEHSWEQIDSHA